MKELLADSSNAGAQTSVPPTAAVASVAALAPPEFIRLPKPGHLCPHTGLSRSKMNELILPCPANDWKPPVKSVSLRKRGSLRGTRLVVYDSLISYLKSKLTQSNDNE